MKIISGSLGTIISTGKNEKGRTPFIEYHIFNGEIKVFHGEFLDSSGDVERQNEVNNFMEEVRRDYRIKDSNSWKSARDTILD